jgi:hypothetical protein
LVVAERGRPGFKKISGGHALLKAFSPAAKLIGIPGNCAFLQADTETQRNHRSAFGEAILGGIPVLEFSTEVARVSASHEG